MRKTFLINLVFLLCTNLLIKPFYVLVIDVTVQNTIGPESYGIFFSLFNFCYLFQIIADLGIQNYNLSTLPGQRDLVKVNTTRILGLKVGLSLIFFVSIFLIAFLFQYPLPYFPVLAIVALNQILLSFILYLRTNFAALGFYRSDSIFSVLDKLILIGILSYLLWFWSDKASFTLIHFVGAQSLSLILTALVILTFSYRKTILSGLSFSWSFSWSLIRASWPYASAILLMTAYTRMDGVMIERLLSDGQLEAGIYAAAYRLLDASNMIGYLFAGLLIPMFARLVASNKPVGSLLSLALRLMIVISIILSFYCYFNSDLIMSALYPQYADSYYSNVLSILILSFIAMGLSYILGSLLTANGNIRQMNIIFLSGIFINFVLNMILILQLKAYGAAIATLFTQFLVMAGQAFLVMKIFHVSASIGHWVRMASFVAFSALGFGLLSTYTSWNGLFILLSGAMASVLVSLLLKFIDIGEIISFLKDRVKTVDSP